jgi:FkbM family methyltransferase
VSANEAKFFSQFREDEILDRFFEGKSSGCCVEVGAHDGVTLSTTLYFETIGWKCLLIEPIPEFIEKIRRKRTCAVYDCAASSEEGDATFFVTENAEALSTLAITEDQKKRIATEKAPIREIRVKKRTLDSILMQSGFTEIDFITIDVEGHELDVLHGFTIEKHSPRIIIIEDNTGQVDREVPRFMECKGYCNFLRTGVNDWYAKQSDKHLVNSGEVRRLRLERHQAYFRHRISKTFAFLTPFLPASVKRMADRAISSAYRWSRALGPLR